VPNLVYAPKVAVVKNHKKIFGGFVSTHYYSKKEEKEKDVESWNAS
jgi:hypothetical protein